MKTKLFGGKTMKKKVIKPFSVEAYRNGAKVETKSGRSVRILCTDLKDDNYSIVAAIASNNGAECSCVYDTNGHFLTGRDNNCDLVIVEEVEEPQRWAEDEDAKGEGWIISQEGVAGTYYVKGLTLNDWVNYEVFATQRQAKSALAMARISQLMEHDERYGGVVTDEEWKDISWVKYVIVRYDFRINTDTSFHYDFLAFHNIKQRDLFLAENERLVKDYLMID